jgi:putative ABC transport system substrate-binding protein
MVGGLINPNYPDAREQSDEFKAAAAQLGVQPIVSFAGSPADIEIAFSTLKQQQVSAILISNDPLYGARRDQLVALAARHSIPAMHFQREFVAEGGLMSYGPSFADAYRQGGAYVGRVLKGEKPADLPILQPIKFELVLNLKTAKSLGLMVPPMVLALADEVIE